MPETSTTSRRPRVLLISASVGAGHNSAARAIREGLERSHVEMNVEMIDALDKAPWWFRLYYSGGFATLVSYLPWAYGIGYVLTDRPQGIPRGWEERLRLWRERRIMKPLLRYIEAWNPDLIVNTHFLSPPIVEYLQRTGRIHAEQFVTVTDIPVHRFWDCRGVKRWFVPADTSIDPLRRWGIDPETITVSGMPIHPKWHEPCNRSDILTRWKLPADRPIVLLTGGTVFTCGPVVRIARKILAACPQAQLVVLAGRNKSLLADLAGIAAQAPNLLPVAFTDRSHELVDVADVMITKAGGITTAECAARGTPMILMKPVPGQEYQNGKFFADRGAAVTTSTPDQIVNQLCRLLADPSALRAMSTAARALAAQGTETIVQAVETACTTMTRGENDSAGGA